MLSSHDVNKLHQLGNVTPPLGGFDTQARHLRGSNPLDRKRFPAGLARCMQRNLQASTSVLLFVTDLNKMVVCNILLRLHYCKLIDVCRILEFDSGA